MAAGDYERGRPGYPSESVRWILGPTPLTVLDAGAGTGKLTAEVLRQGHDVIALDPDSAMLAALSEALPGVRTLIGSGEATGLPDASVDAVVFGQAWHWVDVDRASEEAGRVLRQGGVLGLLWNIRDETVPWVARLTGIMHGSAAEDLIHGEGPRLGAPFGALELLTTRWSRRMSAAELFAMARSRSYYISGTSEHRSRVEEGLGALLAELPELADGGSIDLPYVTYAYRATRP